MAGYMIANITVTDPEGFAEYGRQVAGTVANFGGKYLVRGGAIDAAEGEWTPTRLVILEFDSLARAREWYDSEEYAPLKELRMKTSTGDLVFVEGV